LSYATRFELKYFPENKNHSLLFLACDKEGSLVRGRNVPDDTTTDTHTIQLHLAQTHPGVMPAAVRLLPILSV